MNSRCRIEALGILYLRQPRENVPCASFYPRLSNRPLLSDWSNSSFANETFPLNAFLSRPREKPHTSRNVTFKRATANEEYSRRGGNELRTYLLAARAGIMRAFIH